MNLKIHRIYQDDCTVGIINYGSFRAYTLELPWLNNLPEKSCIPAGVYNCVKHVSPSKGPCVSITNVPNRTFILIHSGNYTSHTLGCVLVGDSIRDINADGTPDVTNSKQTLNKLLQALPDTFNLEIK